MNETTVFFKIFAKHFSATVILLGGKVVDTPPMLAMLEGITYNCLVEICHDREWAFLAVER